MSASLVTLLLVFPLAAQFEEPPLLGQPDDYSGAVGQFQIDSRASPTKLQAEDPLEFVVRIGSTGKAGRGPRRPDLRKLESFRNRFHIEDLGGKIIENAAGQIWEYRYQLKPLNDEVTEIPALKLVFYKPGSVPRSKGYRTTYATPIALEVRPRPRALIVDQDGKAVRPPESFFEVVAGEDVLRRQSRAAFPDGRLVALFLAVPPTFFMFCYLVWRIRNPDRAGQARRRKSRAARQALKALAAVRGGQPHEQARATARVLGNYLCQRLDFPLSDPTPREAGDLLQHALPSTAIAQRVREFYGACDAARFGPEGGPGPQELAASAAGIITAIENEPCPQ
ncbi:MAG: hypothetical protein AB7K24_12535 [Gemmataceae bacterium]